MNLGTRLVNHCLRLAALAVMLCYWQVSSVAQMPSNPPTVAGLAERLDAILGEEPAWMLGEK